MLNSQYNSQPKIFNRCQTCIRMTTSFWLFKEQTNKTVAHTCESTCAHF